MAVESVELSGAKGMSKPADTRSVWQRYRLPIVLGVVAVCLYLFSIAWIVLGRGQAL